MSPIPSPDPDNNIFIEWALKILGMFAAFITGIVSTTWAIAAKMKGFEAEQKAQGERLERVEETQRDCPGRLIAGIDAKLDHLTDRIDKLFERDK